MDQRAVVLSSQVPISSLSRIFAPLSEQHVSEKVACRSVHVATKLNELQLGAPQAAWAVSDSLCEILCHKAEVGKVFKALASRQRELGIKLQDVKSCVKLGPMPSHELHQGLNVALRNALLRKCWLPFPGGRLLRCDYTAAAAGKLCQAELAAVVLETQLSGNLLLVLRDHETVRWRPFSVEAAVPEGWGAPEGFSTWLQCVLDPTCRTDINRRLAAAAHKAAAVCCVLPDLRHARLCGVSGPAPGWPTSAHGATWLAAAGSYLPAPAPYHVLLRCSEDTEEVPFSVPPWCCWSDSGLSALPPGHSHRLPPQAALQLLSDAAIDPHAPRWGGRRLLCSLSEGEGGTALSGSLSEAQQQQQQQQQQQLTPSWSVASLQTAPGARANLVPVAVLASVASMQPIRFQHVAEEASLRRAAAPTGSKCAVSPVAPRPESNKSQPPLPPRKPTLTRRAAYAGLDTPLTVAHKTAPLHPRQALTPASAAQPAGVGATGHTPYRGVTPHYTGAAAGHAGASPAQPAHTEPPVIGKRPGVPPLALGAAKKPRPTKRPTARLMPSIPEACGQEPLDGTQPSAAKPVTSAFRPCMKQGGVGRAGVAAGLLTTGLVRNKATKTTSTGLGLCLLATTPPVAGAAIAATAENASASLLAPASATMGVLSELAAKPAAKQRVKASDLDAAGVNAKVAEKAAAGKLAELTVPEAKCWLKERKLLVKGKKEDLVHRIQERIASHAGL